MNYSSVHEVSIASGRNSHDSEIIRKQQEIIKKQEKQI